MEAHSNRSRPAPMPQYTRSSLDETQLAADPLEQFQRWLAEAQAATLIEPTAMALATADAAGEPAVRIVLFKGLHEDGLTFFTNYESHKGSDLAANPRAAVVFWWDVLERQVRVEGRVERAPRALSQAYAESRPRASQIAARVSRQSRPVKDRAELEARCRSAEAEFSGRPVPLSESWGGYVLRPHRFEFWQGRGDRLHDRLCYVREGARWRVERLEP